MMKILANDIFYIKSITDKARTSFQKFENFTVFIDSEAKRIEAKDIKSVADDIKAIKKLFIEA
jgi:hypothetical protein